MLTIITRTHGDRRQYVRGAASCVYAQTYRPIEWLIVEDGPSTAADALHDLSAPDGITTRILTNRKLGRSAAANRGLDEAKGLYVCFFDDDDELFPAHAEVLIALLRVYVMAAGAYAAAYRTPRGTVRTDAVAAVEGVHFVPSTSSAALLETNLFPIQAVVFRRSAVYHQRFDTNLDALEDWLFWTEIFLEKKIVWTPQITSRYFVPADAAERESRLDDHRVAEAQFQTQAGAFLTERGMWRWGEIVQDEHARMARLLQQAHGDRRMRNDRLML